MQIYGNDLPSFSKELYFGLYFLISCLSKIRASEGFCVTMISISSDFESNFGTISLLSLDPK